jgi:hypothetical protein
MGDLNEVFVFCALYSGVVSLTLWFTLSKLGRANYKVFSTEE